MLGDLQEQQLIVIEDGARVTWEQSRKKPKTHQSSSTTAKGAAMGGLWGLLFGLLFFAPVLGLAVGTAAGALTRPLTDVGIDDGYIRSVREKVKPGTSALFLLTRDAVVTVSRNASSVPMPS